MADLPQLCALAGFQGISLFTHDLRDILPTSTVHDMERKCLNQYALPVCDCRCTYQHPLVVAKKRRTKTQLLSGFVRIHHKSHALGTSWKPSIIYSSDINPRLCAQRYADPSSLQAGRIHSKVDKLLHSCTAIVYTF